MGNYSRRGLISRFWWMPMITGLICVGLGIWCLCDPTQSLPFLAYVFAGCLTAAGLVNTIIAFSTTKIYDGWGWMLALGLLELICGIWLFCLPAPVLLAAFMYMIGIWILVVAVEGICESFAISAVSPVWVIWSVLLLIATVAFAIIFLSNPMLGAVTEWIYLGISLVCYGVYRITISSRLKQLGRNTGGML